MNNTAIACRIAAAAALLLGLAGLAGWLFGVETLKRLANGWVAMQANTAALLALCGASLLLICPEPGTPYYALRKRAAFSLAALAVLAGFLTILEYVYGFNFGLDQILFSVSSAADSAAYPGRMAASTALCFMLAGLGILLADLRVKRWTFSASEIIALAVMLTAFHSFISYLYVVASGTLSNQAVAMAPHTAAGFMFLGAGLILARPGGFISILSGRGISRTLVLLTVPTAFLVPAAFAWLRLLAERRGFHDGTSGVALASVVSGAVLITVILYTVKVVRKMDEELHVTQFSVDNSVDAVLWSGPDGRILYANKAAGDMLGYTGEEMVGLSVIDISASYKMESWTAHWAALKDKGSLKYETEFRAKDGSLTPVEINSRYISQYGREYKCVYASDITARRQTQRALRELAEMQEMAGKIAKFGGWSVDLVANVCHWSDEVARIHEEPAGFSPPLEKGISYYAPEWQQKITEVFGACASDGVPFDDEMEIITAKGSRRWVRSIGQAERDAAGRIVRVSGSFQDITERKNTEAALAESEKRFKALFSGARDSIFIMNIAADGQPGSFIEVNDQACERLGIPREDLLKLAPKDITTPSGAEEVPALMRKLAETGHVLFEAENRARDGRVEQVEISLQRVELEAKSVYMAIARDISERKRFEAELEKAKVGAEAANLAKRDFLSKMSHEIRTPMNAILGFTQLMRRDPVATGPQIQRLDIINRSGEHLLELINEVLDISRIESGRLTLNKAAFDLHTMLEELKKTFMAKAEEKNLRLELEILKGVPRFFYGDGGKLRQVISNIISNALKFTERGGVSLRLRAEGLGGPRFRVEAEVQDSGPGMTPGETAALFKPFEQTQAGRKEGTGTGLGLAISREYSRLMGGGVEVASKPGEGSTFKVSVILEEAGAADIAAVPVIQNVKALKPGQPPCRVLIADDKEDNRIFLSELLGMLGFETRMVADGAQALKEFEAWTPQLILMDLRMPGMDGHEAIKRLRTMEKGKLVKIIAISASAFTEVQQEAIASGADDFIAKPFRESELFEKIGKLTGVEYIYEDQPVPAPGAAAEPLAAELFAGCPAVLLNRIREAALACDFDAIAGLADQVKPVNPKAARGLLALALKYDSKSILKAVPEGKP